MPPPIAEVHEVLAAINSAWRTNTPQAMREYLHPAVTMALPGFTGTVEGREALLGSFAEFCSNARVLSYSESDENIHVVDDLAVASFRFLMVYERATYREESAGRDLWVFRRLSGRWVAVWRTMMDLGEVREARS